MVSITTPICDYGWPAPAFDLPATDGKRYTFEDARGSNGLLVMFICNHCPYVKAVLDGLVRDTAALLECGIGSIAIMSNDPAEYPEDSWEQMTRIARDRRFPFPYAIDDTQAVARAYGAVCTPDFFGFNAELQLQYRGRFDGTRVDRVTGESPRELYDAMRQVALTGHGPLEQTPSIGCSIKWRN